MFRALSGWQCCLCHITSTALFIVHSVELYIQESVRAISEDSQLLFSHRCNNYGEYTDYQVLCQSMLLSIYFTLLQPLIHITYHSVMCIIFY